jgi:hypothetical protein
MPKAAKIRLNQERVLALLQEQTGRGNALKAGEIVEMITGRRTSPTEERYLRAIIKDLRLKGNPICTHSCYGYWWAASADDLHAASNFLRGKAMSSLRQITKLRNLALPTLIGQLDLLCEADYRPPAASCPMVVDLPVQLVEQIESYLVQNDKNWNQLCADAVRLYLKADPKIDT